MSVIKDVLNVTDGKKVTALIGSEVRAFTIISQVGNTVTVETDTGERITKKIRRRNPSKALKPVKSDKDDTAYLAYKGIQITKVIRCTNKNATVLTNIGIKVKVPIELAIEGTTLDEKRIGLSDSDGSHRYLDLTSARYKLRCIDYSVVSDAQRETFESIAKSSLIKCLRKGWIKRSNFNEVYVEYINHAWEHGYPYRMSLKPEIYWAAYVFTCVSGYIKDTLKKKAEKCCAHAELADLKQS